MTTDSSIHRHLTDGGDLAGLPYTHIAVFVHLLEAGPTTVDQLVEVLPREYPTVAKACSQLYDADIIDRQPPHSDRRAYLYNIPGSDDGDDGDDGNNIII